MTALHEYVVVRLAPDRTRGEVLNVGIVLFSPGKRPEVRIMAPVSKLRALDAELTTAKLQKWKNHIERVLGTDRSTRDHIRTLAALGYCVPGEPGMFSVDTEKEFDMELAEIRELYILPLGTEIAPKAERRTRLTTELKKQFNKMKLLGRSVDDLSEHLVVPNVPIPDSPDLKADFVFKNGIYRVTQTLDYRVSLQGAHQKISEACTKSIAADLAAKSWGSDTLRLAVVNVPTEMASIADSHLDLLYAHGFEIFHADDPSDLARYHSVATGQDAGAPFSLQ